MMTKNENINLIDPLTYTHLSSYFYFKTILISPQLKKLELRNMKYEFILPLQEYITQKAFLVVRVENITLFLIVLTI